MIELLTADEMAALDRRTIETVGVPGMVLMENAADGCARAILERWPDELADGAVVLAGPGNNGGDGHVIARKLANRGVAVEVWLLADPGKVRGDARTNLDLLPAYGVPVRALTTTAAVEEAAPELAGAGVLVDALFGTGLQRELGGRFAAAVEAIGAAGRPVMAVDIPSGVEATEGRALGSAVRADLSVTFCRPKLGHFLHPGADLRGALEVVDIGVPDGLVATAGAGAHLLDSGVLAPLLAPRAPTAHKGTFGHVVLLAGSRAMPGAAVLAANAALAAGAGLVTLIVPEGVQPLLRGLVPEVIVRSLPAADGGFAAEARDGLARQLVGKTGLGIGPGVGRTPGTVDLVRHAVRNAPLPTVVDADGLRALEGVGGPGSAQAPRVLTPHPGELAGLLGVTTGEVQADRPAAVRRAADTHGATVLLKGAGTLIATPGGALLVNPTGNPGMGSAGTGDVLTGLLASMLAQPAVVGTDPARAAAAAAFLHGLAGDVAAADLGEPGLRASHITGALPRALAGARAGNPPGALRWR